MELRVHGVGGSSVEGMLKCDHDCRPLVLWRSQREARCALYRRSCKPGVCAYHWAPLTSGSRWFALWPLLLPFTLSNVAGFMGPSGGSASWWFAVAAALQALALTAVAAAWVVAAAWLVAQDDATRAELPFDLAPVTVAVAIGAVVVLLLIVVASYSARGFERYRLPAWGPRETGPNPFTSTLADERFFDGGWWRVRAAWAHAAVASGTLVALGVVADGGDAGNTLGIAVWGGTGAIATLAIVMAVLSALGGAGSPARTVSWRLLPGATAAAAPVLFGGLAFAAALLAIDVDDVPEGAIGLCFAAYGWAVLIAGLVALGCVAWRLLEPSPAERAHDASPGPGLAARSAARIAPILQHVDLVAIAFSGTFVVAAAGSAALHHDDWREYDLEPTAPVVIAQWTLALLLTTLVVKTIKSRGKQESLRRVGILWDVFTFWPRTFHPLAVRPYAERAVPELRTILEEGPTSERWVTTAHSQGSILVYAALLPRICAAVRDPAELARARRRWALVTVGSPLSTLYTRAFPAYFAEDDFWTMRALLKRRWSNLYRQTDYVGRSVFGAPRPGRGVADFVVPASWSGELRFHSDYFDEPQVHAAGSAFAAEALDASKETGG